jgi:hypothetical protein
MEMAGAVHASRRAPQIARARAKWVRAANSDESAKWSILVRLLVGLVVFFPEGIQKLVPTDILGALL